MSVVMAPPLRSVAAGFGGPVPTVQADVGVPSKPESWTGDVTAQAELMVVAMARVVVVMTREVVVVVVCRILVVVVFVVDTTRKVDVGTVGATVTAEGLAERHEQAEETSLAG